MKTFSKKILALLQGKYCNTNYTPTQSINQTRFKIEII